MFVFCKFFLRIVIVYIYFVQKGIVLSVYSVFYVLLVKKKRDI
nr:MAG TPA: hypothetical protein [Caudoviricetes sp.]